MSAARCSTDSVISEPYCRISCNKEQKAGNKVKNSFRARVQVCWAGSGSTLSRYPSGRCCVELAHIAFNFKLSNKHSNTFEVLGTVSVKICLLFVGVKINATSHFPPQFAKTGLQLIATRLHGPSPLRKARKIFTILQILNQTRDLHCYRMLRGINLKFPTFRKYISVLYSRV
jgi:hypothetical protein